MQAFCAAVPFSVLSDGATDGVLGRTEAPPIETAEERDRLWAAIAVLPDDCRETLLLYYYRDVTYQDLAAQLHVSAATVKQGGGTSLSQEGSPDSILTSTSRE